MTLKEIWIVRHGYRQDWVTDTPYLPTHLKNDPPLSDLGRKQAQELAVFLKNKPIDRIYSSPFYRVLETVYPLVQARNNSIPLYADYSMAEWYGGAYDTYLPCAPLTELKQLFPLLNITEHQSTIPLPTGIETAQDCHIRVKRGLDLLITALDTEPNGPSTILLSGHAATAICAVRGLLNDANYPVRCGVCSLSRLERQQDGSWQLTQNGDCSHLSDGEQRHWTFTGDIPDYEIK